MTKDEIKNSGIVFTPSEIVKDMLDNLNYSGKSILNKKIMENSFGEGAFLEEILIRIINAGRDQRLNDYEISNIIKDNVYGIEKDKVLYEKSIKRLNNILIQMNFEEEINWSALINADTLKIWQNYEGKFDFVIGNPPYVRIHNLSKDYKDDVKFFDFYNGGMYDLYLIFIEISFKMLNDNGEMCLITPKSWFTSNYASKLRKFVVENNILNKIIILGNDYNPFDVSVYTVIFNFKKSSFKNQKFSFRKYDISGKINEIGFFPINFFYFRNIFIFNSNLDLINFYKNKSKIEEKYIVKNGLATLNDSIFILKEEKAQEFKMKIKIKKASTNNDYYLLYPYDENGNLYDLNFIMKNDMNLYNYLIKNKIKLENRSLERKELWWSLGRSQGIKDIKNKKIFLNNLYQKKSDIKIGYLNKNHAIFSGLYITRKDGFDIEEKIMSILKTDNFINFVKIFGNPKSHGYFSINSKYVQWFINLNT